MAEPLLDILLPYLKENSQRANLAREPTVSGYLTHLCTLSLSDITSSEPQLLSQSSQSLLRSLQALSKRSHKSIIEASDHTSTLRRSLPNLATESQSLQSAIPKLEEATVGFSQKYARTGDNPVLDRRRRALLLSRNIDRISDVLELPTLLSTAISTSTSTTSSGSTAGAAVAGTSHANYAAALDLHAHIKRLHALYPNMRLIDSIFMQAEDEMKVMTSNLISSLQASNVKLAGAMRTIGWLRRVAPDLSNTWTPSVRTQNNLPKTQQFAIQKGDDIALSALFLVCRLANMQTQLSALEPLRELADQETEMRLRTSQSTQQEEPRRQGQKAAAAAASGSNWTGGHQTERYLKRYIELFREHSFAIVSMHRSIFPSALPPPMATEPDENQQTDITLGPKLTSSNTSPEDAVQQEDPFGPIPSPLATFTLHLTALLSTVLTTYLPNVRDRAARDTLLTQVLFCAGSLGRLGGDFSMMLALLNEQAAGGRSDGGGQDNSDLSEDDQEEEWATVMKRHRVQANRLQILASGLGTGRSNA